jgi:hypothetical protein
MNDAEWQPFMRSSRCALAPSVGRLKLRHANRRPAARLGSELSGRPSLSAISERRWISRRQDSISTPGGCIAAKETGTNARAPLSPLSTGFRPVDAVSVGKADPRTVGILSHPSNFPP